MESSHSADMGMLMPFACVSFHGPGDKHAIHRCRHTAEALSALENLPESESRDRLGDLARKLLDRRQ